MDEEKFSRQITRTLDWGLTKIDDAALERLRTARSKALASYSEPVSVFGWVIASGPSGLSRHNMLRKAWLFMPVIALLTVWLVFNFPGDEAADPNIDIDAALLGHELPIQAFLDQDMDTWINGSE